MEVQAASKMSTLAVKGVFFIPFAGGVLRKTNNMPNFEAKILSVSVLTEFFNLKFTKDH